MMTSKDRWLAALRLQPVDRLLFWPKLNEAYPQAQNSPFREMKLDEIHEWIGSDNHIWIPDFTTDKHIWRPGLKTEVRKRTSVEVMTTGDLHVTVFHTHLGRTRLIRRFDVASQSWHPIEFPIKNRNDIRLMTEWFLDCSVEVEKPQLEKAKDYVTAIGSRAVTWNEIGQSPLMYWIEFLTGIENGHYLLIDYPSEVEELFRVIHRNMLTKTEILCEYSLCDILYLLEDTSTTLISPQQFHRYCYNHIAECGSIVKEAGKILVLHTCGHLKALLPDLARLPVAGFEAFTSPPVGNTSLPDGRKACPDKCLIGGTNGSLWTKPAEQIISEIEADLDLLTHHRGIVVTSGGEMPPVCKPETIRVVCEWVQRKNVKKYSHI